MERGKPYKASRFCSQFAICLLTGTSAVFAVVLESDTATKRFRLRKRYFLILGILIARWTIQNIKSVEALRNWEQTRTCDLNASLGWSSRAVRFADMSAVHDTRLYGSLVLTNITHPCPAICDPEGPGLELWVTIRTVIKHRPSVARTNSGMFGYSPHVVGCPFF